MSYNSNTIHLRDEMTQKNVTVTTSATELFTGGSRNAKRQVVNLYNDGAQDCFIGPTGVTASGATKGTLLEKKNWMTWEIGDVGIFAITDSSSTNIIVTELA